MREVSEVRIVIGGDHAGVLLKAEVSRLLLELGHQVRDIGTNSPEPVDYPNFCIPVAEAVSGEVVQPGRVLVAPAGRHLKLRARNGQYVIHLDSEPTDSLHRPSVDIMMESVAKTCGRKCLGVLLTGMGSDGAKGMRAVKEAGGTTLAESEEPCIVYGMPKSAIEDGVVDKIVPIYDMVDEILKVV